jgi:hypothetical protein
MRHLNLREHYRLYTTLNLVPLSHKQASLKYISVYPLELALYTIQRKCESYISPQKMRLGIQNISSLFLGNVQQY